MENQKVKKIPIRKCSGCGEHFPKNLLIRIVRRPDGEIVLDLVGKVSGRGAYLCRNTDCLKKSKKGARMTALLGDMRELGDNSSEFHKEVGRYFGKNGGKLLMTMGGLAKDIAFGALEAGVPESKVYMTFDYNNVERIGDTLVDILKEGDVLLVKASRAIGAERVVGYIKSKLEK